MDEMIDARSHFVVAEDREAFRDMFLPSAILEIFNAGKHDSVRMTYRRIGENNTWYWYETVVMRQDNPFDEDILCVAMSRNIDAQKAEEDRLRQELKKQTDELHLQSEELRLTMSQMGKTLNYYDIANHTLTMSPAFSEPRGLPRQLTNYPASLFENSRETFPPETRQALTDMYAAIHRGSPTGSCEIFVQGEDGHRRWERLTYVTIFDNAGVAQRAVVSIEDITDFRSQEAENQRLRENEQILNIAARHSMRFICCYDIDSKLARPWNQNICNKCPLPHLCEHSYIDILQSDAVLPEGKAPMEAMFSDIHSGVPGGEYKIRFKDTKVSPEQSRWFDVKYSTIQHERHRPSVALISFADITEQYEREIAYQRHQQLLQDSKDNHLLFLESDLTTDLIEQQGGGLLFSMHIAGKKQNAFFNRMIQHFFTEDNRNDAIQFFSTAYLLGRHVGGNHNIEKTWQVRSRRGKVFWLRSTVNMVTDSYSNHVKALFRIEDITTSKEEALAVQRRAEQDGMTGLLNRATCEERIRAALGNNTRPGILVLLDLDDLKGINDTFGHEFGDIAIKSIAEMLKTHFRQDDIVGRLGGDEFAVYLSNCAGNEVAVTASLTRLLDELTTITIGNHNARTIHCSLGCTTELEEGDTFTTLYRRADLALYHVKRHGKHNIAFYDASMEDDSH